jgi:hypothetical protein
MPHVAVEMSISAPAGVDPCQAYNQKQILVLVSALKCDLAMVAQVDADSVVVSSFVSNAVCALLDLGYGDREDIDSLDDEGCNALRLSANQTATIMREQPQGRRLQSQSLFTAGYEIRVLPDSPIVATVPAGQNAVTAVNKLVSAALQTGSLPLATLTWQNANNVTSVAAANSVDLSSGLQVSAVTSGGSVLGEYKESDTWDFTQAMATALGAGLPLAVLSAVAIYFLVIRKRKPKDAKVDVKKQATDNVDKNDNNDNSIGKKSSRPLPSLAPLSLVSPHGGDGGTSPKASTAFPIAAPSELDLIVADEAGGKSARAKSARKDTTHQPSVQAAPPSPVAVKGLAKATEKKNRSKNNKKAGDRDLRWLMHHQQSNGGVPLAIIAGAMTAPASPAPLLARGHSFTDASTPSDMMVNSDIPLSPTSSASQAKEKLSDDTTNDSKPTLREVESKAAAAPKKSETFPASPKNKGGSKPAVGKKQNKAPERDLRWFLQHSDSNSGIPLAVVANAMVAPPSPAPHYTFGAAVGGEKQVLAFPAPPMSPTAPTASTTTSIAAPTTSSARPIRSTPAAAALAPAKSSEEGDHPREE